MTLVLSLKKQICVFILTIVILCFEISSYAKGSFLAECQMIQNQNTVTLHSFTENNNIKIKVDLLNDLTPNQKKTSSVYQGVFIEDSDFDNNFYSIELKTGAISLLREVLLSRFGRQGIHKIWDQIKKIEVYSSHSVEQWSDVKIILLYSERGSLLGQVGHYYADINFCQFKDKGLILM